MSQETYPDFSGTVAGEASHNIFRHTEMPVLAVVIPCYNEAEALPLTMPRLLEVLDTLVDSKKNKSVKLCVVRGRRQ